MRLSSRCSRSLPRSAEAGPLQKRDALSSTSARAQAFSKPVRAQLASDLPWASRLWASPKSDQPLLGAVERAVDAAHAATAQRLEQQEASVLQRCRRRSHLVRPPARILNGRGRPINAAPRMAFRPARPDVALPTRGHLDPNTWIEL